MIKITREDIKNGMASLLKFDDPDLKEIVKDMETSLLICTDKELVELMNNLQRIVETKVAMASDKVKAETLNYLTSAKAFFKIAMMVL